MAGGKSDVSMMTGNEAGLLLAKIQEQNTADFFATGRVSSPSRIITALPVSEQNIIVIV